MTPQMPLAVQLYTLRNLTAKDFAQTVRQVAELGYNAVELAGFGNLRSVDQVKAALDDAGLKVAGSHVAIDRFESDLNAVLDENERLGNRIVCVPGVPEHRRKTADDWKALGEQFTKFADRCAARGFEFAYHNHHYEFKRFDGRYGLDILLENSGPRVKSELDTYWVRHGGEDPVAYMKKIAPRLLLLHLKDMAAGPDRKDAPVGTGLLDFAAILAAGKQAGVKEYIVEQDDCHGQDPIEALRTSIQNLRKLGVSTSS